MPGSPLTYPPNLPLFSVTPTLAREGANEAPEAQLPTSGSWKLGVAPEELSSDPLGVYTPMFLICARCPLVE